MYDVKSTPSFLGLTPLNVEAQELLVGWHSTCPDDLKLFVVQTPDNGTLGVELNHGPKQIESVKVNSRGWQIGRFMHKGDQHIYYMYSAFYDDRIPGQPVVRMVAFLLKRMPPIWCTFSKATSDGKHAKLATRKASPQGSGLVKIT